MLVNTSFNLSWEPIVLRPEEAYATFMQSEMDVLVLGDFLLRKTEQPLGMTVWADNGGAKDATAESPWADPVTGEPLLVTPVRAVNAVTGTTYAVDGGIPRLFVDDTTDRTTRNVTQAVKEFYEDTPFPNYDDFDGRRALLEKAREGLFARLLNEQIPYNARVLEVGCGTGQLTNFLAIANRSALGIDVCMNSLRLAQKFKVEHGLDRAAFAQMNLFAPAVKNDFFDIVISNGVLHHTHDCRRAFRRISKLVRPGGFLVVGLYNVFSRKLLHYPRVALYRLTGVTSSWLDPHFGRVRSQGKKEAWFRDQYCHPHETCHSLDEVLAWINEDGMEFVNSIPKAIPGPALNEHESLFEAKPIGTHLSRLRSQIASIPSGYREGGLFIVIARRTRGSA